MNMLDKIYEEADGSYLGKISGPGSLRKQYGDKKSKGFFRVQNAGFLSISKIKLKPHGIYFLFLY